MAKDLSLSKAFLMAKDSPHSAIAATMTVDALYGKFKDQCGVAWGEATAENLANFDVGHESESARVAVDALIAELDGWVHWIVSVKRILKRRGAAFTVDDAVAMLESSSFCDREGDALYITARTLSKEVNRLYGFSWSQVEVVGVDTNFGLEVFDDSAHEAAATRLLTPGANITRRNHTIAIRSTKHDGRLICGHCLDETEEQLMPDIKDAAATAKWDRCHMKCVSQIYTSVPTPPVGDGVGPSGSKSTTAVMSGHDRYQHLRSPPVQGVNYSNAECLARYRELKQANKNKTKGTPSG